ncbi:MAG: transposase [Deltaproteobacteria bacterium]|nr:transposase [Deltaproteobacteria bacterium]
MREKRISQLSIFHTMPRNQVARELEAISRVLDDNPGIYDLVYRDMVRAKRPDTGREGMTAEQVLRCTILKQYRNLSYEELAFHLEDSQSFRAFCRLGMGQRLGYRPFNKTSSNLGPVPGRRSTGCSSDTLWSKGSRRVVRFGSTPRPLRAISIILQTPGFWRMASGLSLGF